MGILRKLSFWSKGSKATPVEPVFISPPEPLNAIRKESPRAAELPKESPRAADLRQVPESPRETTGILKASPPPSRQARVSFHQEVESPKALSSGSPRLCELQPPVHSPVVASAGCSPVSSNAVLRSAAADTTPQVKARAPFKAKANPSPSPAPSCDLDQEDVVNFDAPLEDTYAGISEAFGQMISTSLQSAKWDKRSQALKAITTVLKGLDLQSAAPPGSTGVLGKGLRLRDRVRCWHLSCQLLHHCMRDKVMPVRLAAHELFTDTFANTSGVVAPAVAKHAVGELLEHLIDRLGDSNVRLHESARRCVLFVAERPRLMGLRAVLKRLRQRLASSSTAKSSTGERTKVHFGIIDTVSVLLQHFPGNRRCSAGDSDDEVSPSASEAWTQPDVAPFIVAGMDDALGARVRNCAVSLAVVVHQTLGSEAMEPVLAGLRPAKQALLKQKFEECEDDLGGETREGDDDEECDDDAGGEIRPDLDGLMVCGKAVKAPSQGFAPELPGRVGGQDEECMMDGILEEAGMVFNGTAIASNEAKRLGQSFNFSSPGTVDNYIGDDFWDLERELAGLGMDLEGLDEQQALLSSLSSCQGDDFDCQFGMATTSTLREHSVRPRQQSMSVEVF